MRLSILLIFLDFSFKLKTMCYYSNKKNIFVKLNATFKITINNAIGNINNIVEKLSTIDEINSNIKKYKRWAKYGWYGNEIPKIDFFLCFIAKKVVL